MKRKGNSPLFHEQLKGNMYSNVKTDLISEHLPQHQTSKFCRNKIRNGMKLLLTSWSNNIYQTVPKEKIPFNCLVICIT